MVRSPRFRRTALVPVAALATVLATTAGILPAVATPAASVVASSGTAAYSARTAAT